MHEAARTLVKSPPELWAELSDAGALGRHLGAFGEIRITRLEPEVAVAWEGTRASGTVGLEPAGWGTKVTLTALEREAPPAEEPAAVEPGPEQRGPQGLRGLLARLRRGRREEPAQAPTLAEELASIEAGAGDVEPVDVEAVLDDVLGTLGAARHRPFSRG